MNFILRLLDRLAGWWIDWRMGMTAARANAEQNISLHRFGTAVGDPGKWEATLIDKGEAVARFAMDAAAVLEGVGADNYFQFDIMPRADRGQRPVRITLQWANGLSPAQKNAELVKEIEKLRAADAAALERDEP